MSAKLPPPDLPPPNKFARIPVLFLHLHLHLRPTSPSAKTIMSDEYASSGFKGSLVNPCTCSHPPQYSSSNTSLPLLHSHQRHTTPPPTRVLSTLFRLRNEELPPARRQYVPILDSPYIDARSRAFTPVFFSSYVFRRQTHRSPRQCRLCRPDDRAVAEPQAIARPRAAS